MSTMGASARASPAFGRVEAVEASIFGESALIDRVCCHYVVWCGVNHMCQPMLGFNFSLSIKSALL
jgi:hypothetical protein